MLVIADKETGPPEVENVCSLSFNTQFNTCLCYDPFNHAVQIVAFDCTRFTKEKYPLQYFVDKYCVGRDVTAMVMVQCKCRLYYFIVCSVQINDGNKNGGDLDLCCPHKRTENNIIIPFLPFAPIDIVFN